MVRVSEKANEKANASASENGRASEKEGANKQGRANKSVRVVLVKAESSLLNKQNLHRTTRLGLRRYYRYRRHRVAPKSPHPASVAQNRQR